MNNQEQIQEAKAFWQEQLAAIPRQVIERHGEADARKNASVHAYLDPEHVNQLLKLAAGKPLSIFTLLSFIGGFIMARLSDKHTSYLYTPKIQSEKQEGVPLRVTIDPTQPTGVNIKKQGAIIAKTITCQHYPFLEDHAAEDRASLSKQLRYQSFSYLGLQSPQAAEAFTKHAHHRIGIICDTLTEGKAAQVTIHYNETYYNPAYAKYLLDLFLHTIATLPAALSITIGELEANLRSIEKYQSVQKGSEEPLTTNTLVRLWEKAVEAWPDATAISYNDEQLSYKETAVQAQKLAHYLHTTCNLQAGQVLAIQIENPLAVTLGMLAAQYLSVPFLTLDPQEPEARAMTIRQAAGSTTLLDQIVWEGFHTQAGTTEPITSPTAGPRDPAYILFTSGSTGTPKGIEVLQQNLANTLAWHSGHYAYQAGEAALQLVAPQFDAAIEATFGPLLAGVKLVLTHPGERLDFGRTAQIIEKEKINYITVSAAWYQGQLTALSNGRHASLRQVILGGEKIGRELVKQHYTTLPDCQLHGEYGPTECSITALSALLDPQAEEGILGHAIHNARIYILDEEQKPILKGQEGEIAIAGGGLAQSYLSTVQPLQTTTDHLPGPVFLTGDKGLMHPDGTIHFRGRKDEQIKIRGTRIEPGEIEQQMYQVQGLHQAVVLCIEAEGHKRLIGAYTGEATKEALKAHLTLHLPAAFIPEQIIALETMPLTANGKIDRKAIAKEAASQKSRKGTALSTATEKQLATLWSEMLSLPEEDVHKQTDFFSSGGHSLRAAELSNKIRQSFGVRVSIADIFQHTVLSDLAGHIDQQEKGSQEQTEISPAPPADHYPLSSAQKRLYFLQELAPESTAYNMPMLFPLGKDLETAALQKAINGLMEQHESLRTCFEEQQGEVRQRILPHATQTLWEEQLSKEDYQEKIKSFVQPFDLSSAPLCRFILFVFPDGEKLLMIDLHHIIADGRSCSILIEDFWALYQGEALSTQPIQYKDYAHWQNERSTTGKLAPSLDYWQQQLQGELPRAVLPQDYERPPVFDFSGAEVITLLNDQEQQTIDLLCKEAACTRHMVLIALFKTLLHKYSGQTDIILGTTIEGRQQPELHRVAGMFVNSMAIRSQIQPQSSFIEFLHEVKHQCLMAYKHQEVQFETLIEALGIEREPSRNPLFDICIVSQNFKGPEEKAQKTSFQSQLAENYEQLGYKNTSAKFDLTLFIEEATDQSIRLRLEYYTGILKEESAQRILSHLRRLLQQLAANPAQAPASLEVMGAEEKALIRQASQGPLKAATQQSVLELIAAQVTKNPEAAAITSGQETSTYAALDTASNQVAHYLHSRYKRTKGNKVAIMLEQNHLAIPLMLGILKAGQCYVPLDPAAPAERLITILSDAGADTLMTEKACISLANTLQWECEALSLITCYDSDDIYGEIENPNTDFLLRELWNHVANTAENAIDLGGWASSFTGEPFTAAEMQEYTDNAVNKIKQHLPAQARILEIGCASGLTLYPLAPHASYYLGTDISEATINWNRNKASEENLDHIDFACLSASEIDQVTERNFDMIVINSVVQSFAGHNYLRDVINKCINLLAPQGMIFLGDLMDQDLKANLLQDLHTFKAANKGKGYQTRTSYTDELFISREFIEDLPAEFDAIRRVDCSTKVYTLSNELSNYRFDAFLYIDKTSAATSPAHQKHKQQEDLRAIMQAATTAPAIDIVATDAAYMIYTSGTTGKPKGVLVGHESLLNYTSWAADTYVGEQKKAFPLYSSITFDLTVTSIYLPLATGNQIYCYTGQHKELLIQDIAEDNKVEAVKLTPSHLRLLNESLITNSKLNTFIVGGEALSTELAEATRQKFGTDISIYNEYGPTEATVGCTVHRYEQGEDLQVSIGKPIDNTGILLLNEDMSPAPLGLVGEIYIAGTCLAKGYHNNPGLNKTYFAPHPADSTRRTYRTGDKARMTTDGKLYFCGRVDKQVKIKGYRVEKEEIQLILQNLEEIKEAIIIDDLDQQGQRFLAAYYIAEQPVEVNTLREKMGLSLPQYMIPAYFIALDTLPLTRHGKIDLKALPKPGITRAENFEAHANETEAMISRIWQDVLQLSEVSVNENFFNLGGNSLRLVMVYKQLQDQSDIPLKVANLFEYPTIRTLANFLQQEGQEEASISDEALDASADQLTDIANLFNT